MPYGMDVIMVPSAWAWHLSCMNLRDETAGLSANPKP